VVGGRGDRRERNGGEIDVIVTLSDRSVPELMGSSLDEGLLVAAALDDHGGQLHLQASGHALRFG
jgi:hypothetical protein